MNTGEHFVDPANDAIIKILEDKELRAAISTGVHSTSFETVVLASMCGFITGLTYKSLKLDKKQTFFAASMSGSIAGLLSMTGYSPIKQFSFNQLAIGSKQILIGCGVSLFFYEFTQRIIEKLGNG